MGTMPERYTNATRTASGRPSGMESVLEVEFNMDAVRRHVEELGMMSVLEENSVMRQRFRTIIRKEIKAARGRVAKDVHDNLTSDPRKAYRAVRHTVYKHVFGGNLNILSPRVAGARYMLVKPRTLQPGQWGGNRRKRSDRTKALEEYFGKDRGFILRFINSGTEDRYIRVNVSKTKSVSNAKLGGRRGNIRERSIFSTSALYQSQAAVESINEAFEQEFVTAWNEL